MSERDQLLAILRRVRRRLRGLAALQGAVVGAAAALAVGAPWLIIERWRGGANALAALPSTLTALLATAAAAALLAAGAWAARRVPLQRCARQIDRRATGDDRTLSALVFLDAPPTAFTLAAIGDAVARAGGVHPAEVAPLRRPRGLMALAAASVALLTAALAPLPRQPGRALATAIPTATVPRPRATMTSRDLDAEREAQRAAEAAARALSDQTLAALAKELNAAIGALARGDRDRGEALEQLAALQRRADEAAREAAELADGLRRAGQALQSTPATRPLSAGLAAGDAAATEQAANELAAQAENAGAGQRESLAKAFERAAKQTAAGESAAAQGGAGAASSSGDPEAAGAADEERQRRLQRPNTAENQTAANDGSNDHPTDRRLQHLDRDLRDTAAACRENPAACQQHLRDRGRSLSRMQQESRGAEARERLAQAIQQLRERLRRDDQTQRGDSTAQRHQRQEQRRFARAAGGQSNRAGARAGDPGEGDSDDPEDGDQAGDEASGEPRGEASGNGEPGGQEAAGAAAAGAADEGSNGSGQASAEGAAGNGDGIGHQTGGDALGREKDQRATRGHEREAAVRSATGPKRAQVIEAAAARGFAHGDYHRVYQDYDAVVEESLDATAVPPGQRYLVRRYFQLIRPRTKAPPPLAAPSGGP